MNIDVARHVIRAAFRSSRELSNLLPLLKDNLDAVEYQRYTMAIAAAIAATQLEVINTITADYPELEAEIEMQISKYDRVL
jgi:hypothetical protein